MENFDVTAFFKSLIDNQDIAGIVGEYKNYPAIFEEVGLTPDDFFIILCDQDIQTRRCRGSNEIIDGYFDFSLKFIGIKKTSRAEMRTRTNILLQALEEYSGNCVTSIAIRQTSNNLIDPDSERPYVAIQARVYFR